MPMIYLVFCLSQDTEIIIIIIIAVFLGRFHAEALGEKDVECVSGDGQGVCEREVGSQALEGPEEGVQHTASTAGAVMPSPVAAASFPASSQNRAMGAEESCDDIEEFDDDVIW